MAYEEFKSTGVTADTPEHIVMGAGTIHKGLKFGTYYGKCASGDTGAKLVIANTGTVSGEQMKLQDVTPVYEVIVEGDYVKSITGWNAAQTIIGATSGGNTLEIAPELKDLELDGAWVKAKGLTVKTGETATMEINLAEITPDIIKMLTIGASATSGATGYDVIEPKTAIEAGDYVTDLAYVGKKLSGEPIIVIFDTALCTSGLKLEGKSKDNGTAKATFECYADVSDDLRALPWHVYYPTPAA